MALGRPLAYYLRVLTASGISDIVATYERPRDARSYPTLHLLLSLHYYLLIFLLLCNVRSRINPPQCFPNH